MIKTIFTALLMTLPAFAVVKAEAIVEAAKAGNLEIVKSILKSDPSKPMKVGP